MTAHIVVPY
nr:Chain C, MET-THR-ALA-HIS-ILE-VAL-VAL-PRO-TYR [Foot-and-mouth disease virus A]